MASERLYINERYLAENTSKITETRMKDGHLEFTCEASVFFAEGGGQPSDIGTVSKGDRIFDVIHAYDESLEDDVWHVTDAAEGDLEVGDEVTLSLDWDYRLANMQRHLGEHMLSGVFDSMFDGANKGFHIGHDFVTVDIDLGGRMFTEDELDLAERVVNEAIWANLPVSVVWFDKFDDAISLPLRKAIPHDGRISVVVVGDPEDPFDCIACCGVHPENTAEVGLLSIYKCEPNKGMNRIYFDCGSPAKEKLSQDSRMLYEIAKKHSCSPSDLASRLEIEEGKHNALKESLASMTAYIKEAERDKIIADIKESSSGSYVYSSNLLEADDLLKLGFEITKEVPNLLIAMKHTPTLTCLLISSDDSRDCGAIVREFAREFGGKGGGRPDNARAIFENKKDLEAFVSKAMQ